MAAQDKDKDGLAKPTEPTESTRPTKPTKSTKLTKPKSGIQSTIIPGKRPPGPVRCGSPGVEGGFLHVRTKSGPPKGSKVTRDPVWPKGHPPLADKMLARETYKTRAPVRELAKTWTVEALETLVQIMLNKKEFGSVRVVAAREVLDRAWGKPVQSVNVTRDPLEEMDDAELDKFIAALATRLSQGAEDTADQSAAASATAH